MRSNADYIYFMDPLRGILMALGVVLHSAQVFNADKSWLIYSEMSSPLAPYIVSVIHLFRMPAFFIVAGFFCLLTIKKNGPNGFLKSRANRILIPLVVTAFTLNSAQAWLLAQNGWFEFDMQRYFLQGQWLSHLWFLAYLFVYVLFAYLWSALSLLIPESMRSELRKRLGETPVSLVLMVLPLYFVGLLAFGKWFPEMYTPWLNVFSAYDLLCYFPYFCFGLILHWQRQLFDAFSRWSFWSFVPLALWVVTSNFEDAYAGSLHAVLNAYASSLIVWISCHGVFSAFREVGNRPSRLFMFTSSVSYTVYLFHHILVIGFGLLFNHLGIGGTSGMLLLTILVLLTAIMADLIFVSRFNWSSFLFNGVKAADRPLAGFTLRRSTKSSAATDSASS